MYLLQKASAKGSNVFEAATIPQMASDLGFLTKDKTRIAPQNVKRALKELEDNGYLTRWQKYKGEGVPLTIKLDFSEAFLRKKRQYIYISTGKNEEDGSDLGVKNDPHYNPSNLPNPANPSLSSLIPSNPPLSSLKECEEEKLSEKDCEEETYGTPYEDGLPF